MTRLSPSRPWAQVPAGVVLPLLVWVVLAPAEVRAGCSHLVTSRNNRVLLPSFLPGDLLDRGGAVTSALPRPLPWTPGPCRGAWCGDGRSAPAVPAGTIRFRDGSWAWRPVGAGPGPRCGPLLPCSRKRADLHPHARVPPHLSPATNRLGCVKSGHPIRAVASPPSPAGRDDRAEALAVEGIRPMDPDGPASAGPHGVHRPLAPAAHPDPRARPANCCASPASMRAAISATMHAPARPVRCCDQESAASPCARRMRSRESLHGSGRAIGVNRDALIRPGCFAPPAFEQEEGERSPRPPPAARNAIIRHHTNGNHS